MSLQRPVTLAAMQSFSPAKTDMAAELGISPNNSTKVHSWAGEVAKANQHRNQMEEMEMALGGIASKCKKRNLEKEELQQNGRPCRSLPPVFSSRGAHPTLHHQGESIRINASWRNGRIQRVTGRSFGPWDY